MKLAASSIRRRDKNGCFSYRCLVNRRRTENSLHYYPDRAMLHTIHEQMSYKSSYQEFIDFVTRPPTLEERKKHIKHTTRPESR